MKVKLKKLRKDDSYDQGLCAASRCKRKSTVLHGPGTTGFPEELGTVPLCDAHNEKAEGEELAEEKEGPSAALIPSPAIQQELATEAQEAKDVLAMVREYEIVDQDDYDFANGALGEVKSEWKKLDAKQKKVTKPLGDVLKEVRSWFKPAKDHYNEAERIWKEKLADAHRKAEEAQDKALKEAQEAHQAGDAEAVRTAMVQSQASEIQQASNVSMIKGWDFEVTDAGQLPRQYLMPDVQAIGGVVKALGDKAGIPGVRVFEKTTVVRRGA